ncbi:MAG TPA: hypothetical protein VJU54_05075 [Nitrospiraceae bacterium]|nr:hypothetical protein [Nitrospiraceae bacterium]
MREAVSSTLRHSRASTVSVSRQENGTGVRLTIEDDGGGFDSESPRSNQQLGGTLGDGAARERETHILVHFPKETFNARI